MPVPNTIADLSQAAASNSPLGTDTVGPSLDDYLRAAFAFSRQLFDGTPHMLTGVAGTNTITASSPVPFTAYVTGQTFRFTAAGSNTGATTININGLGAKALSRRDTLALAAGDILAGSVYQVTYDGTRFQLLGSLQPGTLIGVQVFSTVGTATYTATSGTRSVIVEAQGGGGAGGGTAVTGAGQCAVGGSGGAGAYGRGRFTSAFSGVTVTVGAGGAPALNANGGNGGQSSFGALLVAPGGNGGLGGGAPTAPPRVLRGGNVTNNSTGGNIVNAAGGAGHPSLALDATGQFIGGAGASSMFGGGGSSSANGFGAVAVGYGAGGGGVAMGQGQASVSGGAGGQGIVIVYEYS